MSNKGQLLQDPFLNLLRKEHVPVSIYLVNGIKLQGHIESFDQYVVLLRNTVTQMVYKHAISTVVPGPRGELPRRTNRPSRPDARTRAAVRAAPTLSSATHRRRRRPGGPARAILVGVDFGAQASLRRHRSTSWRCWPNRPATSPVARVIARRKAPDAALFVGSGKADEIKALVAGAPGRGGDVRPGAVAGAAAQPRAPPRRRRSPTARC